MWLWESKISLYIIIRVCRLHADLNDTRWCEWLYEWMGHISAGLVKERQSYLSSDVLIKKKDLTADWIPWSLTLPRERVKFPRVSPPGLWSTTRSHVTSRCSKPGPEVNKREDEEEEEGVPRTKATKQLRTKRSRPACPSVTEGLWMFPSPQTYGRPLKPHAGV